MAEQVIKAFNEIAAAIAKMLWQAVVDLEQYLETLKDIKRRAKERSKWRRLPPPIIRPLLLDKRSKIHRCRNAI